MIPPSLRLNGVTKLYRGRPAVDGVSLEVGSGTVLGLVGPNGSGKTTLMRVLVGLETATAGRAEVDGRPIRELVRPATRVGALLDCGWFHPRRRARDHLTWMAQAADLPTDRIDAVLDETGLTLFADDPVGGFSLGMRQRLGVAGALLGDPPILVFDEPFNGLDQEATRWLGGVLTQRARQGGIVVLSSHQLTELEPLVDRVAVLGRGRLLFDGPVSEMAAAHGGRTEVVVTPLDASRDSDRITSLLAGAAIAVRRTETAWVLTGADVAAVSVLLAEAGIPVRRIEERGGGLRDGYQQLVAHAALPGVRDEKETT